MLLTADHTDAIARPLVSRMVKREDARLGSRMLAYDSVARAVGKSSSWVRKYIGNQEAGLKAHEIFNIRNAYDRVCERIEAEAAKEERTAKQLLEKFDAVMGSARPVVASMEGAQIGAEETGRLSSALRDDHN